MKTKIIKECGYEEALLGLSLSFNSELEKMPERATKLASKDGGHNKFLESIIVWLDITAPRYWWSQADTYRLSTKQSESTMHTIMKKPITQEDFESHISIETIDRLNWLAKMNNLDAIKNELPEGFLQRRIVCTSYKTLRNMKNQRKFHKLKQWREFISDIDSQAEHKELLD